MKIIVADDSSKNLEAAKKAAKNFPELEFEFSSSASQALRKLRRADGIITDLFFPPEEDKKLNQEYQLYIERVINSPKFQEVIREYYDHDVQKAKDRLLDVLFVMQTGTIQRSLEQEIKYCKLQNNNKMVQENQKRLKNIPPPQFPYGGAIMLRAKAAGKCLTLITDLHRHGMSLENSATIIDGMILLLPLIEKGIITIEQARWDGQGSTTYLGREELVGYGKENPESWAMAIRKALLQKI